MTAKLDPRGTGPGVGLVLGFLGPHMERHAEVVFRYLRRHRPVIGGKKFALVVRDADVRRVLGSRAEFSVDRYTGKVIEVTGDFALGFDDVERHKSARQLIGPAFVEKHVENLGDRARTLAVKAMDGAAARGSVDVLAGYLDPVLATLVGDYLGVSGLPSKTLMSWSHTLFTEIFFCPKHYVRPHAMGIVGDFRAHIDSLIAARRAGTTDGDDVLGRLVAAGIPDAKISGTLLGLVVAWVPNTAKTLALVVDELLERPAELAAAQAAAHRGDLATLSNMVFEAARLRPQGLGIFRTTTTECRVGLDRGDAKTLRSGIPVLACTASAMMDEEAVNAPRVFDANRPATDYLHFGYGMHSCAGREITTSIVPELARALLERGPIHREKGRAGRLQWRYPFPAHLIVRFGQGSGNG